MKWFKHDTDANMDAKLQEVMLDYGLEGYGLYWYCIELIAQNTNGDNLTFELEHDARIIARNTGSTAQKVEQMMKSFVELGLLDANNGHIFCLKLAARCDDFTAKAVRRKGVKPLTNQSVGVSPTNSDFVPLEEEVRSKKKEEEVRKEKELKDIAQKENCAALIEQGFDIFYSAGLVKKSKAPAFNKFKLLVKDMKADPIELGDLLKADIQARIANNQLGIDKLHPATYLNQQRWTDDNEKNDNGLNAQHGRKIGAEERISQRNAERYGQASGGLGMGENGGHLRGTVDQGEFGRTFENVDSSPKQAFYGIAKDWDSADS